MSKQLKRKYKKVGEPLSHKQSVRVLQWNTLADTLSDAFPHTDSDVLKWAYRRQHLCQQILALSPDVIALEEVDHYNDYFLPNLKEKCYDGIWEKKPSNHSADGVAVFWNTKKFKLRESKVLTYAKSNQVAVMTILRHKDKESGICFVATHLKASVGFEKEREAQGKELVAAIEGFNSHGFPVIICGDFNDIPTSDVYKVVKAKYDSAYAYEGADTEAPWTTWKKREREVKRTIDYIWYVKDQLTLTQLLEIPADRKCPVLLPASYYPSDHLAISAEFSYSK